MVPGSDATTIGGSAMVYARDSARSLCAHARIQVNFDDAGSKWLVLAYANLQPA